MNANELAEMLGMHPNSVRRLIREGKIKAKKKGRSYEVDPDEAKSLLNSKSISERHMQVAKAFYVVKEQVETFQMAEMTRLLTELETMQDWVKRRHMAKRSSEDEYLDFLEFALESWQKGRFNSLVKIIDKLREYDKLIEKNEEVKDFSERHSGFENVHELLGKLGNKEL